MALKVSIYIGDSGRSRDVADAMTTGIHRHGDIVISRLSMAQFREPIGDCAVFYGLNRKIMKEYKRAGKPAIYIDLGYWGRHEGGRRVGFHKFARDARHPTAYFQKKPKPPDRFRHFGIPIQPWRKHTDRGYVLVAGMSAKAAAAEGFHPEQWERRIIRQLRQYTKREIIYRPKPNWPGARILFGSRMVRGTEEPNDILRHLQRCHAVVTHHSNVSVDAVLFGVPVFCWDGIATAPGIGCSDLSRIDRPPEAVNREQWAADAAYTQWNLYEMRDGRAWAYLKDEGLVS